MATLIIGGLLAYGLWYAHSKCNPETGRTLAIAIAGLLLLTWFTHLAQLDDLEKRCGQERADYGSSDDLE